MQVVWGFSTRNVEPLNCSTYIFYIVKFAYNYLYLN